VALIDTLPNCMSVATRRRYAVRWNRHHTALASNWTVEPVADYGRLRIDVEVTDRPQGLMKNVFLGTLLPNKAPATRSKPATLYRGETKPLPRDQKIFLARSHFTAGGKFRADFTRQPPADMAAATTGVNGYGYLTTGMVRAACRHQPVRRYGFQPDG
jgi:hypothetical protein